MLETERLILRSWEAGDAEALFALASDPEIGPLCGWKPHASVQESQKILRDVLMADGVCAMVEKATGQVVGSISLMDPAHCNIARLHAGDFELGYWVGRPYWDRGYATEDGAAMLRHAFDDLGAKRVFAGYFDGNDRSRRVQVKLGMTYGFSEFIVAKALGEAMLTHVTCITAEEWRKGKGTLKGK